MKHHFVGDVVVAAQIIKKQREKFHFSRCNIHTVLNFHDCWRWDRIWDEMIDNFMEEDKAKGLPQPSRQELKDRAEEKFFRQYILPEKFKDAEPNVLFDNFEEIERTKKIPVRFQAICYTNKDLKKFSEWARQYGFEESPAGCYEHFPHGYSDICMSALMTWDEYLDFRDQVPFRFYTRMYDEREVYDVRFMVYDDDKPEWGEEIMKPTGGFVVDRGEGARFNIFDLAVPDGYSKRGIKYTKKILKPGQETYHNWNEYEEKHLKMVHELSVGELKKVKGIGQRKAEVINNCSSIQEVVEKYDDRLLYEITRLYPWSFADAELFTWAEKYKQYKQAVK